MAVAALREAGMSMGASLPFIGERGRGERGGGAGRGTVEGGTARTRPRQGRVVAGPSGMDGRVARASRMGRFRAAEGDSARR
jgi:hypothetical protein